MAINDICHKHDIGFIKSDTYGVFAGVFCDFGKQFHVLDVDGKQHCYTNSVFLQVAVQAHLMCARIPGHMTISMSISYTTRMK